MSDSERKRSKRRRRGDDSKDVGFARGSGVDYGRVADRHVDDSRYEKHRGAAPAPPDAAPDPDQSPAAAVAAQPTGKVSSQMQAVIRVMAGMEERTIAQKLADSNRPTWEQYKKDNEDKLNISGLDQKKMEEYRKELDAQRDKILSRGVNHRPDGDGGDSARRKDKKKKKKKRRRRDDDSESDLSDDDRSGSTDDSRRHGKKHKKKKHRRKKDRKRDRKRGSRRSSHRSGSDESDGYSSDDSRGRKRSSKHKKKKKHKRSDNDGEGDDGSSDDDKYRLSSFFTRGTDDDSD